jgi:Putative MetA-pathway of phenol degradation
MTYHWKTLFAGLAALAILLWLGEPSHAEEGGSGQYIIGAYASLLNITPNKPGFAASDSFIFYGGSAGKSSTLPFGGLLASNLNANCYLEDFFGLHAVSTENNATQYRNGDIFHLEATLQQFLPLDKQTLISVGANAFYFQQVTGDSGSGAVLGDFEGTDIGIGPVVTLIHTVKSYSFSAQVKWLPELDTSHRLSGDWVWVSVGLQLTNEFADAEKPYWPTTAESSITGGRG